jgi:hypothetical protein
MKNTLTFATGKALLSALPVLAGLLLSAGFHAPAAAWATANRFGGHTTGGWDSATHTNRWGGTTTGVGGFGAVHTTAGGFSTYRPPAYGGYHGHGYGGYAPYHPPVAVPYYHAGCYDCAGAVAAGAVVGLAAGAAIAHYEMGVNYASLPPGAVVVDQAGVNYYQVGSSWFRPYYGANGVYYTAVPAPY